jgi:hypothetical protein
MTSYNGSLSPSYRNLKRILHGHTVTLQKFTSSKVAYFSEMTHVSYMYQFGTKRNLTFTSPIRSFTMLLLMIVGSYKLGASGAIKFIRNFGQNGNLL